MNISKTGIQFLQQFEGYSGVFYDLGDGGLTVGYGSYFTYAEAKRLGYYKGLAVTKEKATKLFEDELKVFVQGTETRLKAYGFKVNQNQFDALVSYAYNRGLGGLNQLLKNSHSVTDIGNNMVVYWGSNARYKTALINRRKKEQAIYRKPVLGVVTSAKGKVTYTSIIDYLYAHGKPNSFTDRKKLATKYGIKNYQGTAAQNTKLLKLLQA